MTAIRGRFITVEGGEGVGKSTQIDAIRQVLSDLGHPVLLTREPGGTERAERVRELLLTASTEPMPQYAELLLVFAARSMHIENVILPALDRGTWVVCDRFTDATFAYQGGGRGLPRERIATLQRWVQRDLQPDLTLLLDAPVELAMARARQRNLARGGEASDRIESEQSEFFDRVRRVYLDIAKAEPSRVRVIDAANDLQVVERQVRDVIAEFVKQSV